jgi:hypothetical protein
MAISASCKESVTLYEWGFGWRAVRSRAKWRREQKLGLSPASILTRHGNKMNDAATNDGKRDTSSRIPAMSGGIRSNHRLQRGQPRGLATSHTSRGSGLPRQRSCELCRVSERITTFMAPSPQPIRATASRHSTTLTESDKFGNTHEAPSSTSGPALLPAARPRKPIPSAFAARTSQIPSPR